MSTKAPDSEENRSWLGKMKAALGTTGYPVVELMALVETGTRAILGATFGPPATGETDYARRLLPLLDKDMLLLADRGFDAGDFLEAVAATKAQFLVRVRSNRRLPILARLDDGSYLSRIGGLAVRIITADITVTCADGTRYNASYRLATTLVDARRHPARQLIDLYHERWVHELAYLALRHTLCQGRVLRSADPESVRQEMWALLTLYQALIRAMVAAVETRPGIDPDRASVTGSGPRPVTTGVAATAVHSRSSALVSWPTTHYRTGISHLGPRTSISTGREVRLRMLPLLDCSTAPFEWSSTACSTGSGPADQPRCSTQPGREAGRVASRIEALHGTEGVVDEGWP